MSKNDDTNEAELEEEEQAQPQVIWSGIIAFGLVSLPVSLFSAQRRKIALKTVDAKGTPLRRQFYCEHDNRPLERDDIVRSYEIEKYHYVVVEDEELEALEPKKSREIDLKQFVPLSSINPVYFERAYFLVPDGDTTKAYRLLAKSMEDERRAGIATFVMHGRDYLVAIIAEGGILRAETLRFHDELRTPEQIGLPPRQPADKKKLAQMLAAIGKLTREDFSADTLNDPQASGLKQRIEEKLKSGADVLRAPEEAEPAEATGNVIDLMQVLKERLQGRRPQGAGPEPSARRRKPRSR